MGSFFCKKLNIFNIFDAIRIPSELLLELLEVYEKSV